MKKTPLFFGIFGNTAKPEIADVTLRLLSFLRKKKILFLVHDELGRFINSSQKKAIIPGNEIVQQEKLVQQSDIVIALGGDGTMLQTARLVGKYGKPILGVNLGKLGFLAEVSTEDMERCVLDMIEGNYYVDERMVLGAQSRSDNRNFYGLNDIVIDKGSSSRIISIEIHVDNDYLNTYTADGIIVTTPTGSTGYSLSSGGPIVVPHAQVITISPIAPHSLTARPVIVPDTCVIRVIVSAESKEAHLTADGQEDRLYRTPSEFIISKAPHTVKLVKRLKGSFYDTLRKKLLWGRDPRLKGEHKFGLLSGKGATAFSKRKQS